MDRIARIGLLTLAVSVGLTAVILVASTLSVAAVGEMDLVIEMKAPTHVAADSAFVVNVSYANLGSQAAPDNWVRVTVPPGTQFVEATYAGGAPRPPDVIDGRAKWPMAISGFG